MFGEWSVRVAGDSWSLELLSKSFTQEGLQVRQEEGQYRLVSSQLANCCTDGEAFQVANRIVDRINSAACVVEPRYMPVHVEALRRGKPDGRYQGFARASFDAVVVAQDQWSAVAASLVPELVTLQEKEKVGSPKLRALKHWSSQEKTPNELNKILELMRDEIAGRISNKGRAWDRMAETLAQLTNRCSQQLNDDLKRCRNSLNHEAAVGSQARHAGQRRVVDPMNLEQATEFIRELLLAWLRGKQ